MANDLQATKRLVEIIRDLCFAPSLDILMTLVGVAARELTHADGATFVLKEGDQCFYAHENAVAPLWKGQRFPLCSCICGWAINHKQAAIIEDVYSDARIPVEAYAPTFVKSLTVVPMRQDNPVGVIGVYWAERHQPLTQEVELLQVLADTTATVLDRILGQEISVVERSQLEALEQTNAKLRAEVLQRHTTEAELTRLSLTDGLTGLYNRRGFFLLANPKLRQVCRQQQSATVFFIDIDYLKSVNDHYGHEAGDWLILGTAASMHKTFREGDVLARLGGDEFVVLAPDCANGPEVANRLKTNAEIFAQENALPYPLSISVGLASSQGNDANLTLNQLVSQADSAMYAQKQRRRPLNIAETKACQRWGV
ncbi:GGDEF domain-containing protein [Nodosilinea sp. LEGE 06152]|uniref:GGDEF domain-containing protein n=1 Tax=Nodosilinea sp. LEGE 06152 TaxID=2777966 RepID=UPI00187FFDE0|nr:sensor domain-containing diguanylate cyclase [Nodosilinea sp. LEGE 06152]MBE9157318.1 GGDEF domain-containing protein [Nodosilinea sp. LEGE 06152]